MSSQKSSLRQQILKQRHKIDPDRRDTLSKAIVQHLKTHLSHHEYSVIFSFMSHQGEPDLALLADAKLDSPLALPRVDSGSSAMSFRYWRQGEALEPNSWGIMEPLAEAELVHLDKLSSPALVLVPCVAVTPKGTRLGFGGGYYDRLLAKDFAKTSIGVIYSEFVKSSLPSEPWDQKLNFICSDEGFTVCS